MAEGLGSERTKAAASVGVNAFAETPTFDPELFDPKEIRKARGCVLGGRLNYCGELCRSRNEMKLCATRAKSGGEKGGNSLNSLMPASHAQNKISMQQLKLHFSFRDNNSERYERLINSTFIDFSYLKIARFYLAAIFKCTVERPASDTFASDVLFGVATLRQLTSITVIKNPYAPVSQSIDLSPKTIVRREVMEPQE